MNLSDAELMHDLRMPLQLIESGARLLRMALDDPSMDAAGYLDMLEASVRQMRRMLDGAMAGCGRALARGETTLAAVDVAECLRGLCLRCQPRAAECGGQLQFARNVESLRMVTDEDLVCRIVLNLVANALRFTPRGGRVEVRLQAMDDFAEIRVSDTGRGIAAERLPFIFLRGETDGGFGLGLPGARDCARRLGGELSAASVPGRGSAFTLRLPVHAVRTNPDSA